MTKAQKEKAAKTTQWILGNSDAFEGWLKVATEGRERGYDPARFLAVRLSEAFPFLKMSQASEMAHQIISASPMKIERAIPWSAIKAQG